MQSNLDFTIDEYEKSTKEFEKYVSTIPKKVPVKLTKSSTIGSLVKEYVQKSEYTETEELLMLSSILKTLQNWGKPSKPLDLSSTDQIVSLSSRYQDLSNQLNTITKEINSLNQLIDFQTTQTNGFTSIGEIEEVIKVLKSKINKNPQSKDNEKITLQIHDLIEILPGVKKIQKMIQDLEVLEGERDLIKEYLSQTIKDYEKIVSKDN
jgi:hypothetical protein